VRRLVRRTALTLCPLLVLVTGAVGLLYPYLTRWLLHNDAYTAGRIYFVVLMVGIVIASSYLPFTYVLNQWGHPGWFVIFLFIVAMTNALLNY
jgi:Na+-driven multidrug efflux pump